MWVLCQTLGDSRKTWKIEGQEQKLIMFISSVTFGDWKAWVNAVKFFLELSCYHVFISNCTSLFPSLVIEGTASRPWLVRERQNYLQKREESNRSKIICLNLVVIYQVSISWREVKSNQTMQLIKQRLVDNLKYSMQASSAIPRLEEKLKSIEEKFSKVKRLCIFPM